MDAACYRCSKTANHTDSFDEEQLFSSTGQGMTEFCVINDDAVMSVSEAALTCNIQAEINQWINQIETTNYSFCYSCVGTLSDTLKALVEEAKQDNFRYKTFLGQTLDVNETEQEIDAEIANLKKQLSNNDALLNDLETGRTKALENIRKAKESAKETKEIEENFWNRANACEDRLLDIQMHSLANEQRVQYYLKEVERLQASKVLGDLFSIDCSSDIGRINGLRLGRTTDQFVEQSEINAACGFCVLLLYIVCSRLPDFQSAVYSILPLGSCSVIVQPGSTFKIYEPEATSFAAMAWSLVWDNDYDNGLSVLLKCIRELVEWIQVRDKTFHIPHK
mmetsp:Transcript_3309/g.4079  ORF Transcript_3309/g.4079 Transcript_3309/m.4079 type:complete len:336 (-) Transcript_3309:203-1210(-)